MQLSEHFKSEEFQCHDGSALPATFATTIRDTVEFLERLRLFVNFAIFQKTGKWENVGIVVVSGHRSEAYNKKIGGATNSQHVTGKAADVKPTRAYDAVFTFSNFAAVCEAVDASFKDRPYRIGKYPARGAGAFVHVDCAYGFGGLRW